MPDVGVLNLQIRDDSKTAYDSLDKLAGALTRVKNAAQGNKLTSLANSMKKVSDALGGANNAVAKIERLAEMISKLTEAGKGGHFTSVANGIKKITSAVNESGDAIGKIGELADNIQRLKDAGIGFKAPNLSAMNGKSGSPAQAGMDGITEQIGDTEQAFKDLNETIQESNAAADLVDQMAGTSEAAESAGEAVRETADAVEYLNEVAKKIRPSIMDEFKDNYKKGNFASWMYGPREMPNIIDYRDHMVPEEELRARHPDWYADQDSEEFKQRVREEWEEYERTNQKSEEARQSVEELKQAATETTRQIEELINRLNTPMQLDLRSMIDQTLGIGSEVKSAAESMSAFMQEMQGNSDQAANIRSLNPELQQLCDEATNTGRGVKELTSDMTNLDGELKQKKKDAGGARNAFEQLRNSIRRMLPNTQKLGSAFARLVKYRILRNIIKQIAEGFNEGVENVYRYSKAIGSSFSADMDSAASSLLQMKNAVGAAAAPLIQSLIPVMQTLVNWFITGINYLNQFIALLRGQQTWTRAVPTTAKAFDDVKKSAKGASSAVKDLLADWDELNIIQSDSSSSGSGSGTKAMTDYLSMFEEVSTFENTIKGITDFLKNNFSDLLVTAAGIGAAILGWNISSAFEGALATIGSLIGLAATFTITLSLVNAFDSEFTKTGQPGWLIADALTSAVGAWAAGRIATSIAGAGFGQITAGFTLILSGLVNVKHALTAAEEGNRGGAMALAALAAVKAGIGFALVTAGLSLGGTAAAATGVITGILTLGITAAVILTVERKESYKRMAEQAFAETGENGLDPGQFLSEVQKKLNEKTESSRLVIKAYVGFSESAASFNNALTNLGELSKYVSGTEKLSKEDAKAFKDNWDMVMSQLGEMSKISSNTILTGLTEALNSSTKEVKEASRELQKQYVEIEKITKGARAAMETEMDQLLTSISGGTATDAELERYTELYNILARKTDTGLKTVKDKVSEASGFDFTKGDSGVLSNAMGFIKTLQEENIQPALDEASAAFEAEMAALKDKRDELQMFYDAGYISKKDYDSSNEYFDKIEALYKKRYKELQEDIISERDTAYETIAKQVVAGLENDELDSEGTGIYAETVMGPILSALEEAGYQIPETIKASFAMAKDGGVVNAEANSLADFTREAIYEAFKHGNSNLSPVELALYYEVDRAGYKDELENEKDQIVGDIVSVFGTGEDVQNALKEILGWDLSEMLDDSGKFVGSSALDQAVKDTKETVAQIGDEKPGFVDEITNGATEATKAVSTMSAEMKRELLGLNGLTVSANYLTGSGLGGLFSGMGGGRLLQLVTSFNAAGGIIKSGDVFSANENGDAEYIGRYGSNTAVVNNGQIIEGITAGVAGGQEEQNSLLRRQNEILMQLLRKEFTARVTASSGLGRVTSQSGAMYSKMTGV